MLDAEHLIDQMRRYRMALSVAESCTGGQLSAAITLVEGCSDVFLYAQIAYANQAKRNKLGVHAKTLHDFGAVSAEVALEMSLAIARDAYELSGKIPSLGLATTGVAGPKHSENKPVGLVYIAASLWNGDAVSTRQKVLELDLIGTRSDIQSQTVQATCGLGCAFLESIISHDEAFASRCINKPV